MSANGDTLTGVAETSAGGAAGAAASTYPIVITAGSAEGTGLANYTIVLVNGTLTVDKATLTITGPTTTARPTGRSRRSRARPSPRSAW